MILKKPHIEYFRPITSYIVSGGIFKMQWNIQNGLLCLLRSGFRFRIVQMKSNINVLVYKPQNFQLIAFGFFSMEIANCIISPFAANKKNIPIGKLNTNHLLNIKTNLNKPKIELVTFNKSIQIKTKNVHFKINNQKLNYTK